MTEAYPLHWPEGWPRTPAHKRQASRFDVQPGTARQELVWEIERMGARYPVISTNVALRRDGLPYAEQRKIEDPGVAVYFERDGKQMVFACDRWLLVHHNMRAIEKTIAAMRGIQRWGASDMMERAFSAFEALPPPGEPRKRHWREVLGLQSTGYMEREVVESQYRAMVKKAHPDTGGSAEAFHELQNARDEALREIGAK
ncbi:MAG: J domain-containing protein [Rhizobiaceae bacterium]|nr:J domain-containing protein [Rhizobiaceae bacterium]